MASGKVTKVMKFDLTYLDGCGDFHEMQHQVWELQRQVREILNRTIQEAFHWDYRNREAFQATGAYLDIVQETGYKRLDGYIYELLTPLYPDMAANNRNACIQKAWKKYKDSRTDVLRGVMSVPSYKSDQPIPINTKGLKLEVDGAKAVVELTLFTMAYRKEHGMKNVRFALTAHDGTQRAILERLGTGEYKLGESSLIYDRRRWFLSVNYSFTPQRQELDPEKILGVDMGVVYAIYASIPGEWGSLKIQGGEVTEFANRLEARRRSLQNQATVCGEGRVGHGTKARVAPVFREREAIANFRDTINHRYSRAVVDYAVKNGCGTIQMEALTGIKEDEDFPRILRHWTYYDLQTKIENKAKEHGIEVRKVAPRFTSRRCSRCGHISNENRKTQADFRCVACGFHANADYNASQNIGVKDIDKIISKAMCAESD